METNFLFHSYTWQAYSDIQLQNVRSNAG